MNSCKLVSIGLFNGGPAHVNKVSWAIKEAFKGEKKDNLTAEQIVSKVKGKLDPELFRYEDGTQKSEYRRAVAALANCVYNLLRQQGINADGLDTIVANGFTDANPSVWKEHKISIDDISEFASDKVTTKLGDASIKFFGQNKDSAGRYTYLSFKRTFYDNCVVVNTGDDAVIVSNDVLLNNRIFTIKNALFKKIASIFEVNDDLFSYNPGTVKWTLNINTYNDVKGKMEEYLQTKDPGFFLRGYNNILSGQADPYFDAACAYFQLINFDKLVENTVGRFIKIQQAHKGRLTDANGVYYFGFDSSHIRQNFSQDADERTIEQNTAEFTKFIIQCIPINTGSNKLFARHLSTTVLADVVTKVKSAVNYLKSSDSFTSNNNANAITRLQYSLDNYNECCQTHMHLIFKYLADENIQKELKNIKVDGKRLFTSTDFAVFNAVYNYVYNNNIDGSGQDKKWSLTKIVEKERNKYADTKVIDTAYNPVDAISIFANNNVPVDYIDVEYNYDGSVEVKQRPKYRSKDLIFNHAKRVNNRLAVCVNSEVDRLANAVKFSNEDGFSGVKIEGNNIGIDINVSKSNINIFNCAESFQVDLKIGNATVSISHNTYNIRNYVSNYIKNGDDNFKELLKWIDSLLATDLSTEDGKMRLQVIADNVTELDKFFADLINSAAKAQTILNLRQNHQNNTNYKNKPFTQFLNENYPSVFTDEFIKKNSKAGAVGKILQIVTTGGNAWIDDWARAYLIFKGEESKSTSKNFLGKNESNYSLPFLGAQGRQIYSKYHKDQVAAETAENGHTVSDDIINSIRDILTQNGDAADKTYTIGELKIARDKVKDVNSIGRINDAIALAQNEYREFNSVDTAASHLYFYNRAKALGKPVVKTTAKNYKGKVKLVKEMNEGELLYDSFIHGFCSMIGSNQMIVQCTTFSDKTKFVNYAINLGNNLTSKGYENTSLKAANNNELITEYINTVGQSVRTTLDNTLKLYKRLFRQLNKNFIFDVETTGKSLSQLINEQLAELSVEYGSASKLIAALNDAATSLGTALLADTHYIVANGNVQINPLLVYQAEVLYNPENPEVFKNRWRKQQEQFIKDLVSNGIQFYANSKLKDSSDDKDSRLETLTSARATNPVVEAIAQVFGEKVSDYNNYASKWIEGDCLILAKRNGKPISYSETNFDGVEINPLLEKFFGLDCLLSANMRIGFTGSELAHPFKKAAKAASKIVANGLIKSNPEFNILATRDDLCGLLKAFPELADQIHSRALGIENQLQSIQLKRNVIIPATMQYVNVNTRYGVGQKTKVAIIKDIPAKVWEFVKNGAPVDSMDGSSFTSPLQSILENNSLGQNRVGHDKKPIWHSYDPYTNSATLVKFASFEITNERIRQSITSDIALLNIFKQMHGFRWSTKYPNWLQEGILCSRSQYAGANGGFISLERANNSNKPLLYTNQVTGDTYAITDLKWDNDKKVYYTEERQHTLKGFKEKSTTIKVYHLFDDNGRHIKLTEDEYNAQELSAYHTIDSLYELWSALGGCYTVEVQDGRFVGNEMSNQVMAGYVNMIAIPKYTTTSLSEENMLHRQNQTQMFYYQPLKDMFIGYAANTSAVKNGQGNVNGENAWYGNTPLTYMELDNTYLGIQMNADHEMLNSEMTEFSQVITALEANGRTHQLDKQVYYTLGRIARNASKMELEALDLFKENPQLGKKKIYEIMAKAIIDHVQLNDDRVTLTEMLIMKLESTFGKLSEDDKDAFRVPFSDPNIYSQILPTFVSSINKKSIKRKFPGSGCVMCPGYNIMQVYKFNTTDASGNNIEFTGTISDVIVEARQAFNIAKAKKLIDFDQICNIYKEKVLKNSAAVLDDMLKTKALIHWYLEGIQIGQKTYTIDCFGPTDIIDIRDENDNYLGTLSLDDIEQYYKFIDDRTQFVKEYLNNNGVSVGEDTIFKFRHSATKPRNLAPARITWNVGEKRYNVFELNAFRNCFEIDKKLNDKKISPEEKEILKSKYITARAAAQRQFDLLDEGKFYQGGHWDADGITWIDGDVVQCENLKNEPAELIVSDMYAEKFNTFGKSVGQLLKKGPDAFMHSMKTDLPNQSFDIALTGVDENVLITFDKVGNDDNDDTANSKYTYIPYQRKDLIYRNDNGQVKVYTKDKNGNKDLQVGRLRKTDKYYYNKGKYFYTENDKEVDPKEDKIARRLRVYNGDVYEYIEFISRYTVKEFVQKEGLGTIQQETPVYRINRKNIENTMVFSDNIKNSNKDKQAHINKAVAARLDELCRKYNSMGLQISDEMSLGSAMAVRHALNEMKEMPALRSDNKSLGYYLTDVVLKNAIDAGMKKQKDSNRLNLTEKIEIPADDSLEEKYDEYYERQAVEMFNSWKASLYFTAARIPAQSHQSFMQMKVVAYSGSSKNICYVSHWQTFLQGSDYDIDKAYLMGCNIGNDGKYMKWSNLFDYSSEESLLASMKLPVAEESYVNVETNDGIDVQKYVDTFPTGDTNVAKLKWASGLLNYIENYRQKTKDSDIRIKKMVGDKNVIDEITRMLYTHYSTSLSDENMDSAYKNYVSANIQNVIQNSRNFISAYTPISMDDTKDASKDSPKAQASSSLNLMNPATKWIMQVQNMTGKTVIGIAAVGEKVFFNASFVWNEVMDNILTTGNINESDYKYIRFSHTFKRIQGRYDGNITERVVESLADINLDNYDNTNTDLLGELFSINARKSYLQAIGVPNEYIEQKAEEFTIQDYNNMIHTKVGADIMISQILSAATDNAKELILEKINCNSDFAKYYLHLIMLGFDIKDCVKYMTSGAVETVASVLKTNFFDKNAVELDMNKAIQFASLKPSLDILIKGNRQLTADEAESIDEDYSPDTSRKNNFNDKIKESVNKSFEDFAGSNTVYSQIADHFGDIKRMSVVSKYMVMRLLGDSRPLKAHCKEGMTLNGIEQRAVNYIDYIIRKIQDSLTDDYTIIQYIQDIDEFAEIGRQADETSALGNTFLGLNQGIPTDKEGLLSKLNQIEKVVVDAEKRHNIENSFGRTSKKSEGYDFKNLYVSLSERSGLPVDEVQHIIEQAIAYGLQGEFDSQKWAQDVKLSAENQVHQFDCNGNELEVEPTTYRQLTMDYFNLIRLTWNPFYFMKTLPQFDAIIDLTAATDVFDTQTAAKSKVINSINRDLKKNGVSIKKDDLSKLRPYADSLMLDGFLNENPQLITVPAGIYRFDVNGNLQETPTETETVLNLSMPQDRATFKMYVEQKLIPTLQADPDHRDKQLIKDMYTDSNADESVSLALPIDLSHPHESMETSKTFALYQQDILDLQAVIQPEIDSSKAKSITDILMLYNLIVHCNKFGSNRLTSLFQSFVVRNGKTVINQYLQWIGNEDHFADDTILEHLNYNRTDALMQLANVVHQDDLGSTNKNLIVRVYDVNSGKYVYKKYDDGEWKEVKVYGDHALSDLNENQLAIYRAHWLNNLQHATTVAKYYTTISGSSETSDIMKALKYFINIGKIAIIKNNCE